MNILDIVEKLELPMDSIDSKEADEINYPLPSHMKNEHDKRRIRHTSKVHLL